MSSPLEALVSRAHQEAREAICRHGRIALSFSGGRDSLAALYLLREFWNVLTVYYCDTGDSFPEVQAIADRVAQEVPNFKRVPGRVQEVWELLGWPTDLLPTPSTYLGRMRYGKTQPLIERYHCCLKTYMEPLFQAFTEDGATLVIRGQRDNDYAFQPMRSGDAEEFEVFYPIQGWEAADVDAYLASIGVSPGPFYADGLNTTLDCMRCTAWWDHDHAGYLKKHHPQAFAEREARMKIIRKAIARTVVQLKEA